jgi:hypothetical protein
MLCLSYYFLFLLFNRTGESSEQVLPGREGERRRGWGWGQEGEMTQTMYAYVNK